jgi:hypothetical protein
MPLKLCYIQRNELNFDKSKRLSNEEPSITDFEFIKTLGKGGFATVYMGKCSLFSKTFSEEENFWRTFCYENGKKANCVDRRHSVCLSFR